MVEEIKNFLEYYGDGWRDYYDLLYQFVLQQEQVGKGLPIIEIGTFLGGSALVMAHAAEQVGLGKVYSVDIRMREDLSRTQFLCYGRYRESVVGALMTEHVIGLSGIGQRIISIYATSDNALELLHNHRACVVFVDGNHDYKHVTSDIKNYSRLLVPGGVLICHDYDGKNPECRQAINEQVASNEEYIEFGFQYSTAYARKR